MTTQTTSNTFTLIKHENLFTYAELLKSGMEYFRKDVTEYYEANKSVAKDEALWQDCAGKYVESVTDSGAYSALLNYEVDSDGKPVKDDDGNNIPKDGLASATIKRYTDKASNTLIALLNGDKPSSLDEGNAKGIELLEQKFGVKKSNRTGTSKPKMTASDMRKAVKALFEEHAKFSADDSADWEAFADLFVEKFEALNPSK